MQRKQPLPPPLVIPRYFGSPIKVEWEKIGASQFSISVKLKHLTAKSRGLIFKALINQVTYLYIKARLILSDKIHSRWKTDQWILTLTI